MAILGDSLPLVVHGQDHVIGFTAKDDIDRCAIGSVLERIAAEIGQCLPDAAAVPLPMKVSGGLEIHHAACGGSSAKPSEPTPSNTVEPPPATATPTRDAEIETAQRHAAQAIKDAAEAMERVEALSRDLDAFAVKLDTAINDVTSAQNDADRNAASEKLKALQKEQAEMKARIAAAKAAAARAERRKGSQISKECMDNPLAKGCQ